MKNVPDSIVHQTASVPIKTDSTRSCKLHDAKNNPVQPLMSNYIVQ